MNSRTDIWITYSVKSAVGFLDMAIESKGGQLITSVFHKPVAEPYVLSYLSDHSRQYPSKYCLWRFTRANRFSSNVDDFHSGRLKFELTLIMEGYQSSTRRQKSHPVSPGAAPWTHASVPSHNNPKSANVLEFSSLLQIIYFQDYNNFISVPVSNN